MEILIKSLVRKKDFKPSLLRRVARKTLEAEGYRKVQTSILFCSDSYIRKLNKEYRGVDASTDVLAFSMHEGKFSKVHPEVLGDVVISLETASRQAKRYRYSLNKETILLVIHGILHLLGYDHLKKKDKEKMRKKETQILKSLNIKE